MGFWQLCVNQRVNFSLYGEDGVGEEEGMTFTFAPLQHSTPTLEGEEVLWPLLMKELAFIGSVLTIHALPGGLEDMAIWR